MDRIAGSPTLQLFERSAKIFHGLVVDEFNLSVRGHDGYQAGNAVNDQPNAPLLSNPYLDRRAATVASEIRGSCAQPVHVVAWGGPGRAK